MLNWIRARRKPAVRHMLAGVDLSGYQGPPGSWVPIAGNIDWAAVKLTELEPNGHRYVNPDAATDWEWVRAHGKGRIAYLFGHPSVNAKDTVDFFITEVSRIGLLDSDGVALDLEVTDGLDAAHVASWAADVMSELASRLDRPPLLYSFLSFIEAGNCAFLGGYPLWIADPGNPPGRPRVPRPWSTWAIDQYDISGPIDKDLANYPSLSAMFAALGKPKTKEPKLINLGGHLASAVSTARWPDGQTVVAGLGQNGFIQATRWDNNKWSEWTTVSPTRAIGAPAINVVIGGTGWMYYIDESSAVVELVTRDHGKTWR
jgi:lysozyme